jgi:hypothetical protein
MPATIEKVIPFYAKAGDSAIEIIGAGFQDDPSLTKVYHRKHGETAWEAVDPSRVTFVSATELTIAIDAANTDGWDPGLDDVGVSDYGVSTPDGYIVQALYFYTAGVADPDAVIKGAPDAIYVEGLYMGHTHGGLDLDHTVETDDIETDQSPVPVRTVKQSEGYTISVPLAEVSLENLKEVWGLSATIEDLGDGRRRLTGGGDTTLVNRSVMLVLPAGQGKKWAVLFYRTTVVAPGTLTWSKEDQVDLPLELTVLADTSRPVGDQVFRIEEYNA